MATYTNISREEMQNFLFPLGFQVITLPNTKEVVFAKRVDHDGLQLSLRVFTGINPDGNSREVGADAIRVNLFWRNNEGSIKNAGGSKRVHRVTGWKNNLKNRLDNWNQDFVTCGACGAPMVERKGRDNSLFFGCCNYPACRCTRPIKRKAEAEGNAQTHAKMHTPINFSAQDYRAEQEVLEIESTQY